MFVDEHELTVRAGKGGDGLSSFRHESQMPKGGPDGGDGGDGGDVIFVASHHMNGLGHLQNIREIRAKDGGKGQGNDKAGKNAPDTLIELPVGTIVHEFFTEAEDVPPPPEAPDDGEVHAPEEAFTEQGASGEDFEQPAQVLKSRVICDLNTPGMQFVVARGGNGGFGNKHFAHATNQAPRRANPGRPGDVKRLRLEVKLIADVGLVGLPNAGKSTFLARTTRARPKIAAYPFTTLSPYLGIVDMQGETRFVIADIPGLIEGASQGKGLGHQFLRHVERTRVLLHLIDVSMEEPEQLKRDHDVIVGELTAFSPELAAKPRIVAANKSDIPGTEEKAAELSKLINQPVVLISGVTGQGVQDLLWKLFHMVKSEPAQS